MTEDRLDRLFALFEQALTIPAPGRPAFVAAACDDVELRRELVALLAAHETPSGPFDTLAEVISGPGGAAVIGQAVGAGPAAPIPELDELPSAGYRIERELGGGGMSRVFLATEIALGRQVVIKVLAPGLSATMSGERFRREIQLAAQLQHSHIVPLLTAGSIGPLVYYTMPFVAGESLRARLAREGRLPIRDAVKIWRDVLDALAHAHDRKVAHRDIKPGNILLGDRNALVTDFGIAGAIAAASGDVEEAASDPTLGTPAYMAPEQLTGEGPTDGRADLYSAALVMFEMIEGRPAFGGTSTRALLSARVTGEVPAIQREDCPAEVRKLVSRCLARDPTQRPATAEALLSDVESLLRAPASRRPPVGALVGGGILALGVGLGLWALGRSRPAVVTGPAPGARPSIAVIPLEHAGPGPADAALVEGITEELTSTLARERHLRVIASTSVTALAHRGLDVRAIAESLAVSHVLQGSLSRRGDTLRVEVRLVNAEDGRTRWSERFDRAAGDLAAVQGDIARSVAWELGDRIGESGGIGGTPNRAVGPRPSLVAYEWYLRGRNAARGREADGRQRSAEYFRRAIEADSTFAAPHAWLAWNHMFTAGTLPGDHRTWIGRAEQAARRAVALDENLEEGHSALGWVLLANRDWSAAERELTRAIELNPTAPRAYEGLARLYMMTGRPSEQLAAAQRGLDSDPYSIQAIREMALALSMNGRCDESLALLLPLKQLSPPAQVAGVIRGLCFAQKKRWPEAIAEFSWASDHGARAALGFLGYALARSGQTAAAEKILADLVAGRRNSHGAFGIAMVLAGLGDFDRALDRLREALEEGSYRDYLMDPLFADLRRHPQFHELWNR